MNRSGNTGLTARLLWKQRGRAFFFWRGGGCVEGILDTVAARKGKAAGVLDKFV